MTGEDLRNRLDADASGGADRARRIRVQGEIEMAASDLERRCDLGSGELALEMLRTQMGRVFRHEGPEAYFRLVSRTIEILNKQSEGMERIVHDENLRRAN